MKIKYLGTAAYEGIPSLFCTCRVCKESLRLGGKNIRTRAQALINDDLLLDFNADTVAHFLNYKIDSTKIKNCLITHKHSDHFYPEDMYMITKWYAQNPSHINYYGGKTVIDGIKQKFSDEPLEKYIGVNEVHHGEVYDVDGYKVMALDANHSASTSPYFYAIEKDGKKILYAHDTGRFLEQVWEPLKAFGKFDLISFDCVGGLLLGVGLGGHMSWEKNQEMLIKLRKIGCVDDKTLIVLNHFTHNNENTHDELVKGLKNENVIVAYDGLEIEI